jgi:hypothetical protein
MKQRRKGPERYAMWSHIEEGSGPSPEGRLF